MDAEYFTYVEEARLMYAVRGVIDQCYSIHKRFNVQFQAASPFSFFLCRLVFLVLNGILKRRTRHARHAKLLQPLLLEQLYGDAHFIENKQQQ